MNRIGVLAALLCVGTALAQPQPPKEPEKPPAGPEKEKPVEFVAGQSVPLQTILQIVKKMTGREIVVPSTLLAQRGGVQIRFATAFKATYPVLRAVLEVNGITLDEATVDGDKIIRVLTDRELRGMMRSGATPIVEEKDVPKEHELVTAVLRLQYANPQDVERILTTRLMNRMGPGSALSVQGQPIVIVRDYAPEVSYYVKLIRLMDVEPNKPQLYVHKLRNAVAQDVANYLTQLARVQFGQIRQRAPSARRTGIEAMFVADNRTNKLIMLTYKEDYEDIMRIIRELDEEVPETRGTIHIYQLKNVDCKLLAASLQQILSGQQQRQRQQVRPGAPQVLQQVATRVVAEEQTNSLIIEAEKENYEELVRIIQKLDVRRPQVLIEAAIIEVTADSTTNLGIELATVDLAGLGYRGAGASLFGMSEVDTEAMTKKPLGGIGLTALIYKDSLDRIPFLLQMLRSTSDVNVLSTPKILTNDNSKGTIKVSDQVAIVTTVDTQTQQSRTSFGGYQDAGITLTITPHISAGRYLRLDLSLLIESFTAQPVAGSAAPPPKTSRSIEGAVTVPDGHLIIVGGLTSEKHDETINKVPLLGDIPILGALFRSTSVIKRKTNLYIFIRPYILDDEHFDTLKSISRQELRKAEVEGGKTEGVERPLTRPREIPFEEHAGLMVREGYLEMLRTLEEMFGSDFRRVRVEER